MKLSVILPCYNEEENVARIPAELVPELQKISIDYEIVVVDDGSSDGTFEKATKLNIPQLKIFRHQKNLGVGFAFRTAIANLNSDLTVILDADFTFHPRYIRDLFFRFNQGGVDFVGGSPRLAAKDGDIQWWRKIISRGGNFIYAILFKNEITATTSFFRLYKTQDLKDLKLAAGGFNISAEILFELLLRGKRYTEIPVPLFTREFGKSKLNYGKEIFNHLGLLARVVWQKFHPHV